MGIVVLAVASLIALTTLVHYEVLSRVDAWLPALRMPRRSKLLVVMFAVFLAHALQIGLYGFKIGRAHV